MFNDSASRFKLMPYFFATDCTAFSMSAATVFQLSLLNDVIFAIVFLFSGCAGIVAALNWANEIAELMIESASARPRAFDASSRTLIFALMSDELSRARFGTSVLRSICTSLFDFLAGATSQSINDAS